MIVFLVLNSYIRFKKGSGMNGNAEKVSVASEALARRDSRPVFFKFNEVRF